MKLFFITNFILLLIVAVKPAETTMALFKVIYNNYKTPTTLYYISDNPYHSACDILFYKRNNLTIRHIDSLEDIASEANMTNLLVVTRRNYPSAMKNQEKLIYTSYPSWVLNFNINNWLDRTKVWYVYEIPNQFSIE